MSVTRWSGGHFFCKVSKRELVFEGGEFFFANATNIFNLVDCLERTVLFAVLDDSLSKRGTDTFERGETFGVGGVDVSAENIGLQVLRGLVRSAVFAINSKLTEAVETVSEIMADKEVNPAIRLQAAQAILTNAARISERLQGEEFQNIEQNVKSVFET